MRTTELIVIDKPAGLVVHPAAGNPDGTLVNALIAHCGDTLKGVGGVARPGIVHRLDKDTSGLLVAAKTETRHAQPGQAIRGPHRSSAPITPSSGAAPRKPEGMIEGQIGRNPFDRKRMGVLRGGGKEARTRYKVIERFGPRATSGRPFASLIECRLETGRTHQIRVHLTHLGHPLIGDPTYGRARQPPRAKTRGRGKSLPGGGRIPPPGAACLASGLPPPHAQQAHALRIALAGGSGRADRGLAPLVEARKVPTSRTQARQNSAGFV